MNPVYEAARAFICRNARPLDLAQFRFHFEGGSMSDVLSALSAYQNPDGGFGHALEPDCWNPASSPIQTWEATETLYRLGHPPEAEEIAQGILRYLESGRDGDEGGWFNSIPSNNDHPRAPWWQAGDEMKADDNPTACLAGFMLLHADQGSAARLKAQRMAKEAGQRILAAEGPRDMHLIACYIRMVEYMRMAGETALLDLRAAEDKLRALVSDSITRDTDEWRTGYVCRPSQFFTAKESPFYEDNRDIADFEAQWIIDTQMPDGSWAIPWYWDDYPEEWVVAKNWWKSIVIINNLLFLRGMGRL